MKQAKIVSEVKVRFEHITECDRRSTLQQRGTPVLVRIAELSATERMQVRRHRSAEIAGQQHRAVLAGDIDEGQDPVPVPG